MKKEGELNMSYKLKVFEFFTDIAVILTFAFAGQAIMEDQAFIAAFCLVVGFLSLECTKLIAVEKEKHE